MRATVLLLSLTLACRTSSLGACSKDADCPAEGVCGSAGVCVVASCSPACAASETCTHGACVAGGGGCTPACASNQSCVSGVCVGQACNPPCNSSQTCDANTLTCVAVGSADVTVSAPAAASFVTGTVQAAATAHAPGGVTSVSFSLSRGTAALATASGQASTSDPSIYTAAIPLTGVSDGSASLTATLTYGGGQTLASAAVALTVDQTAPTITMQSDGRTALLAAGATAAVSAAIGDGTGSGVKDSTVALQITGHAAVAGASTSAGVYGFSVLIDDTVAPAHATTTVSFSVTASDNAGNKATLSGDPKEVIRVDRDAPAITGIQLPAADATVGGRGYYGPGAPLLVSASISDGAGVDATTVCLRIAGETGACAHPGTAGSGTTYTFSLPRPTAATDGATPLTFTITAADSLYATLTGTSQAEHIFTTAPQSVYFDNQGPAVAVAADPTAYARTLPGGGAVPVTVTALISDATGVASAYLLSGPNTVDAGFVDGGLYQFPLNPKDAPAGVEGPYAFAVIATDGVGNAADAGASRIIDDAPPDASVRIFKDTDPGPGAPGVTYPALAAGTGHTGSTFIYSDQVHVKGTVSDVSGIGFAYLHVDGSDFAGGTTDGGPTSLGCAAAATVCNFDVPIALNDPKNGAFHTGAAVSDAGVPANEAIPMGALQLSITAQDQAAAADGTPSPHAGSQPTPANTTRLLWQQALSSGSVTGLAVHPSGDVIATSSGTAGSVYDLAPDQPSVRWSYNAALGVPSEPAIGAGDLNSAAIYVATSGGFIDALAADGGVLWQADAGVLSGAIFAVGPAVDSAAWTDAGTAEQAVVPDDNLLGTPKLWAASSANASTPFSVTANDVDSFSSPIVFKGFVWFGDGQQASGTFQGNVTRHALVGDGTMGAAATAGGTGATRPYWGLITDGTTVYAATNRPSQTTHLDMLSVTANPFQYGWDTATAHLSGEPTIGIDGNLLASDYTSSHAVSKVAPSTGVFTQLLSLGTGASESPPFGHVPLQGSDGHVYLPVTATTTTAKVMALEGSQLSWLLMLPSATLVRAAAMDCSGRLFVGDGSTVYALVTDDHGLADTPWPDLRRDARNTGNAAAPKYGIRTTGNACAQ